jgi:hypothetical protein
VGAAIVKPKRKCCKDDPRCKKCPVVLKRLEKAGLAKRKGKGYRLSPELEKKQLAAFRARS